jgi:hypothetical protein
VPFLAAQCSCGATPHRVTEANLIKGASTRCNKCAKKQTGFWTKKYWGYADILPDDVQRTRLLDRISACVDRCHNEKARHFNHYGGRGIFVFDPWHKDRRAFLSYLLTLPGWDNPDNDLDRTDNDKGYVPGNLRFVTRRQNHANRRSVAKLQTRIQGLEARLRSCKCGAAEPIYNPDE